ncbi:MAG TPA: hypothetical protein VJ305_14575, partial [Streptosporangiaceae bacterium]|nr:hypothetical protein [Streptosporangiaceae bacterium]
VTEGTSAWVGPGGLTRVGPPADTVERYLARAGTATRRGPGQVGAACQDGRSAARAAWRWPGVKHDGPFR